MATQTKQARGKVVPVKPFLDWFDSRETYLESEYGDREGSNSGSMWRVLAEIGWPETAGSRRIYRLRHESVTGMIDRDAVEDALDHAGVFMWEVYPDVEDTVEEAEAKLRFKCPPGFNRRMTDEQVHAAHLLHVKMNRSLVGLSELLWERRGYANANSCRVALGMAFRGLGLPLRSCQAHNYRGGRCELAPRDGSVWCRAHDPERGAEFSRRIVQHSADARRGRRYEWLTSQLVHEAHVMYRDWDMSLKEIAHRLSDRVPVRETHLAHSLSVEFDRHGWRQRLAKPRLVVAA